MSVSAPQTQSPVPAVADAPMRRWSFGFVHECVLAVVLIVLLVVAHNQMPRFTMLASQFDASLAGDLWPLALLALPMTLIILTGGIDLSVGSIVALCAVVLGIAVQHGWSAGAAVAAAVVVGGIAGLLNGIVVAWLRVHPLIVTLATMSAFRGIALAIGGSAAMRLPVEWKRVVQGAWLGVPFPLWFIGVLTLVLGLFLWKSAYGRFLYAIGYNATAARFSGVPVRAIRLALFTFSGLCCGLAAVLVVAQSITAKADAATGLELTVITAVVLGGVSIFGGRGNLIGVVLGVVLLHEAQQYVRFVAERNEIRPLVVGGLLIGSVLLNSLLTRRGRRSD